MYVTSDRFVWKGGSTPCSRIPDVGYGAAAAPQHVVDVRWVFRIRGIDTEWDWRRDGCPPIDQLTPVRRPTSGQRQRHIPVSAYSMTNGGFVELESGLEHDLVRREDRNPDTRRIVSQPFGLTWNGDNAGRHYPDLLTCCADETVTVWDVRAAEAQNADFRAKVAVTRAACRAAGWRHEVFSGLGATERLNLLWLHGFRRHPAWLVEGVEERVRTAAAVPDATLGSLMALDDGSGELIAWMWHLLWRGDLSVDMDAAWDLATAVALRAEV